MTQVDIIILWLSAVLWAIYALLGMWKMYRTYIGILLWLLFCLLLNLKLNSIVGSASDIIEIFLLKYRVFLAWLSIVIIPLFGLLLLLNNSIEIEAPESNVLNMIGWFIGWAILFPFLLGVYYVIATQEITTSGILSKIINAISGSRYAEFLPAYEYLIFLIIFWILFYKFVLYYLLLFVRFMIARLKEMREQEMRARRAHYEAQDDDDDEDKKLPLH